MLKVICETYDWGWFVRTSRVLGLKETPIFEARYPKHQLANTPAQAMVQAIGESGEFMRYDLPEQPEHS